ncbi:hypothetical protein LINGRAHAP2_LOCUS35569 [Linum grandiflorum]
MRNESRAALVLSDRRDIRSGEQNSIFCGPR